MSSIVKGAAAAVAAFLFWGMTPLYWAPLSAVPAGELILHRVFWSFVLLWILLAIRTRRSTADSPPLFPPRRVYLAAAGTGVLVVTNWLVYVWAVTNGKTLDASLGYYVTPLMNVLLGTILLKERLNTMLRIAILFAAAGVVYLTVRLGSLPWVSLVLALSFGFYGYLKKRIPLGSTHSLALELTALAAPALAVIIAREASGAGALIGATAATAIMLVGAGVITVVPLLLFGYAAKRIRLSDVGFIQYIAPTVMLFIGVFVLGEPFSLARLPGFALVWLGLGLYTADMIRTARTTRRGRLV